METLAKVSIPHRCNPTSGRYTWCPVSSRVSIPHRCNPTHPPAHAPPPAAVRFHPSSVQSNLCRNGAWGRAVSVSIPHRCNPTLTIAQAQETLAGVSIPHRCNPTVFAAASRVSGVRFPSLIGAIQPRVLAECLGISPRVSIPHRCNPTQGGAFVGFPPNASFHPS